MKLANRYEVVRELGRGGMGVVYLARDPMLDRDVAIKVIGQISDERKERFLREARLVAKMDHPGIVSVHDLGEHEDGLFFVMPYVQGVNLRQVLAQSPLSLRQLVDLGIQAAEALEYSHGIGVVHRDVKPENIMVTVHTSEMLRVRLTDFGLAVHATEQRLTTTGALVGTVAYLSPEQVMGNNVAPPVDIYALGTVLYECIAGRTPFKGEIQSVLFRIVHEEPQRLAQLVQDLDPELEALVHSCLAKDAVLRPRHARDVAAALTRYRAKIADSARAGEALRTVEVRAGAVHMPPAAPFVGRAKELAELQNRLNLAVGGESQLVLVAGEAGVGKSRLVEELERLAHARSIRVLSGNFNEQHGATPYQGFGEMLETHLRRASASGTELVELEDELVALFPMLAELRPGRARAAAQPAAAREHDRIAVFDVLARALSRIAGDEPLVLVLEDLHLATVSVEALQYIARRLGSTRALLVGTYTSNEVDRAHPLGKLVDGFKGNKRFSLVELGTFNREEHRSFLATVSLGGKVDETVIDKLYEISEGNPFFTRELFRSLLDTGSIGRDVSGSYQLLGGAALAFDAIPPTIQKAVERRLERLPEQLRQVLATASVLGKSFEEHELEAIIGDDADLDEALDKLVRGGFVEEQRKGRGDHLAFTSGTMREVLYAELPRRKRRTLHKTIAEHLEAKHSGRLERVRAQLVHHYALADRADKVIEHGLELARATVAAFSVEEAVRAARVVLEFVEDDGEHEVVEAEARMLLAIAHRTANDFDAALKELEIAIRLYEKSGDAGPCLAAHVEAAFTAWDARRVPDARRWLDKAMKLARAASDHAALGKLLPLGITIANLRGDSGRARELLAESELLRRTATGEPAASSGGVVRVALVGRASATEPARAVLVEDVEVLSNVFETLLATDEHGHVVPHLAEVWEARDGGKRFLFTLRAGVTFHDGAALTAQDVKASFERGARLAEDRPTPAWSALEAIEAVGPRELAITLREPLPIFPALLTDFRTAVAREHDGKAVGTGPFRITSVDAERVALARNDAHWHDRPSIESLEYCVGIATSALASGFRAGRFDIVTDLSATEVEEIARDRTLAARTLEWPKKSVSFVLFQPRSAAVSSPEVRAALCDSVATSDLVWRHLGRLARPATGLIPPGVLGHDAGRRRATLPTDRAAEMLAREGITPATPRVLRAAIHPALHDRPILRALLDGWAALGVKVEMTTTDVGSFLAQIRDPAEIDLSIQRWAADYDDPDSFTYALFDSRAGTRRALYSDPALDRALEEARLEASPVARVMRYRTIEEGLLAAHVILPLWHDEEIRVCGRRLHGVVHRPQAPFIDYAALHVREPRAAAVTRGTIRIAVPDTIASLDPHVSQTVAEQNAVGAVFEALTREDAGARIAPWLAESMTVENGGRRSRIVLRGDVRFHDGRPLTARDVRYSFERALATAPAYYTQQLAAIIGARAVAAARGGELSGIRIHSPRELTIELETPLPSLPALMSIMTLAIIPEGSNPAARNYRDGCIGTGPFRVLRAEAPRRYELEANPYYWRPGLPRAAAMSFEFGLTGADALAQLRAGRYSLVIDPPAELASGDGTFAAQRLANPKLATFSLTFNSKRGPFADIERRRAVVRALDVEALARGRALTPARTLLPPGLLGHDPVSEVTGAKPHATTSPSFDLDATISVSPRINTRFADYLERLTEMVGAIGIRLERSVSHDYGVDLEPTADVAGYIGGWIADYPDPDTFHYGVLHSEAGIWGKFVGTPELDVLVERVRGEQDRSAREAACRDVEALIADQALIIPLFHDRFVLVAHPNMRGLAGDLVTQSCGVDFARLSLEE